MKRFFVTVTPKDGAPIGYDTMMIDAVSKEEAIRVSIETVSEEMGYSKEAFSASSTDGYNV